MPLDSLHTISITLPLHLCLYLALFVRYYQLFHMTMTKINLSCIKCTSTPQRQSTHKIWSI